MTQENDEKLLSLPPDIGEKIVQSGALLACPLLGTDGFGKFCCDRGIKIDRERLLRLERLGMFSPVFRVQNPGKNVPSFNIPLRSDNNWFDLGYAWDTTGLSAKYDVPHGEDHDQEGYYSVFQIEYLVIVLQSMTLSVHLDSYLDDVAQKVNWNERGRTWLNYGSDYYKKQVVNFRLSFLEENRTR